MGHLGIRPEHDVRPGLEEHLGAFCTRRFEVDKCLDRLCKVRLGGEEVGCLRVERERKRRVSQPWLSCATKTLRGKDSRLQGRKKGGDSQCPRAFSRNKSKSSVSELTLQRLLPVDVKHRKISEQGLPPQENQRWDKRIVEHWFTAREKLVSNEDDRQ